jgi:hypothetical protein
MCTQQAFMIEYIETNSRDSGEHIKRRYITTSSHRNVETGRAAT